MAEDAALRAGAERFSGFGDLYESVRPRPPAELARIIGEYRGSPVRLAVDLGCGTGLSSRWMAEFSHRVIAVEPSDDMRRVAEASPRENIEYRAAWSHATGLEDDAADVVVAAQALHWMEPGPTFAEVARILRPGGVFAALDCDWPPVVGDAAAEAAWDRCRRRIRVFERRIAAGNLGADLTEPVTEGELDTIEYSGLDGHDKARLAGELRSWSKSGHLGRMRASGRFSWCREVVLSSAEEGNADRFVGLLKSQGDYQTVIGHGVTDELIGTDDFADFANERLGNRVQPWWFMFRVRIGLTPTPQEAA